MSSVLIDVAQLADAMLSDTPPVVLDVRWQLGDDDGHARYRTGHIPGAVYVDLDSQLAGPPSPEAGRHPLPEIDALTEAARSWGIDDTSPVVVYDDNGNLAAARAWWLLRWGGHRDVRLLDGGLTAWRDSGMRLSTGDTPVRPGSVTLRAGSLPTATIDDVAALGSDHSKTVLVDARAAERYRGEVEPIDPRAGHIPGAISVPTSENVDESGRFRAASELRERFAQAGVTDGSAVVAYCGSGVNAAHEIAALEIAGLSGTLFPGSWSQWSADPARPAEI
ncbi:MULTISPECIES: sulfurtransferase [unclassified Gordonia (in: high G+C Gram-positive bacteria)]|uniref:sulfurtransferase n=1 Tax=unclassified Gordonia (in: high G+C Gram-positive bacteria) TaxID=2657482 RepID=UPI000AA45FAF|nr:MULTISPECIES: sulfurtransferase [unclassified Gordonia (in: high G+C Gram-positive bacteria)]